MQALDAQNWAVYLGDFAGREPRRLTFAPGFNGFPSLSPDGTKLLFARFAVDKDGQRGLATFVQDVSSLNIGPRNRETFGADWGVKVVGDPDRLDRRQPVQHVSAAN